MTLSAEKIAEARADADRLAEALREHVEGPCEMYEQDEIVLDMHRNLGLLVSLMAEAERGCQCRERGSRWDH